MKTDKQRLKELAKNKTEACKAQNQVRLTLGIAESRQEWQVRWDELRKYALTVSADFCRKRSVPNYREIAKESLSEAWRYVCNGEKAERAITMAVDAITQTLANHQSRQKELPELPDHDERYHEVEETVDELISELPEKLRPVAVWLSEGMDNNCEIAELIGIAESTVRKRRGELRTALADRYPEEPNRDYLHWLAQTWTEDTVSPCKLALSCIPLHEWLESVRTDFQLG